MCNRNDNVDVIVSLSQGQVEVCVKLQVFPCVQEEADYYVVLVGSSLHHVTTAHRAEDHCSLRFTVPGETLNISQDVIHAYRAFFFVCVKTYSYQQR